MSKQRVKTTNLTVWSHAVTLYQYSDLTMAEKIQQNAACGGMLSVQDLSRVDHWVREAGVRSDVQVIALTSGDIVAFGSGGRKVLHIAPSPQAVAKVEEVKTKEGKGTLLTFVKRLFGG